MVTRSGTLLLVLSNINSQATSKISTHLTSLETERLLHPEAVTEVFASGTLRATLRSPTSPLRMVLPRLPFLPTIFMSPLDLWTRVFAFGTLLLANLSYVLRVSKATRIVSTLLPSLPLAIAWSVAVLTRLSRCGSCPLQTASFLDTLPAASASALSKATR